MRVDELSRQELTERQTTTTNELTAQVQGLQDRVNFFERLQRIPACRISVQWKIIPRSQSTGGRSKPPRGMPSRDQSMRPDIWNPLGTWRNDSVSTPYRGILHPWNHHAIMVTHCNRAHQHRLVRHCMGDSLSVSATAQCPQRQARRDLQQASEEQNRDTLSGGE